MLWYINVVLRSEEHLRNDSVLWCTGYVPVQNIPEHTRNSQNTSAGETTTLCEGVFLRHFLLRGCGGKGSKNEREHRVRRRETESRLTSSQLTARNAACIGVRGGARRPTGCQVIARKTQPHKSAKIQRPPQESPCPRSPSSAPPTTRRAPCRRRARWRQEHEEEEGGLGLKGHAERLDPRGKSRGQSQGAQQGAAWPVWLKKATCAM